MKAGIRPTGHTRSALALLLAVCCTGAALAGQAPPAAGTAQPQPPPPVVEKFEPKTDSQREAFGLMKDMANYLSNLSAFSFNSTNSFEVVQANGQKIEFGETRKVSLSRPDKLRVEEVASDGVRDLTLFDGKQITVLGADENVYAQAVQPPRLDDAIYYYTRDLKMRVPMALMLTTQFKLAMPDMVKEVDYVEETTIGGKPAHHIAGRTEAVDFQFWITNPPQTVPVRVIITYKLQPGMPQYKADLSAWNTSPKFASATFALALPKDAQKIPFAVQMTTLGAAPAAAPGAAPANSTAAPGEVK